MPTSREIPDTPSEPPSSGLPAQCEQRETQKKCDHAQSSHLLSPSATTFLTAVQPSVSSAFGPVYSVSMSM